MSAIAFFFFASFAFFMFAAGAHRMGKSQTAYDDHAFVAVFYFVLCGMCLGFAVCSAVF